MTNIKYWLKLNFFAKSFGDGKTLNNEPNKMLRVFLTI